jgi:hypothetical protein
VDHTLIEELLVFAGLMTLLGSLTKIVLSLIQRRRALPDTLGHTLDEMSGQLRRLEQAVDATALEVERIAEGQRFTTKLLAEAQSGASPALDSRGVKKSVTPH